MKIIKTHILFLNLSIITHIILLHSNEQNWNILNQNYIDFNNSLRHGTKNQDYIKLYSRKKNDLQILERLYKTNNFSHLQVSNLNNLKIPKIIHQIWLGSPFPEKYKNWQKSWKKLHPDWKYILWTDKEVSKLKLINQDLYDKAKNYGEKSDILRYEILYKFGGLYVDTDFKCLKSFEPLNYAYNFYAGIGTLNRKSTIINALIASSANHPILNCCVQNLKQYQKYSVILKKTGPIFFTKQIIDYIKTNNLKSVLILPPSYFYPLPDSSNITSINKFITLNSFAVHYWEGSFKKRN